MRSLCIAIAILCAFGVVCAVQVKGLEHCHSTECLQKSFSVPSHIKPGSPDIGTGYFLRQQVQTLGAKCLDGTPGLYYHQPGIGTGENKWYVHHMGGGWCTDVADCYYRSTTDLGSTSRYPEMMDINSFGGYFSADPNVNPLMYNWNKVYIIYCDGGSFSGLNSSSTTYQGNTLWFRGKAILDAVIEDLQNNRELKSATDAVISGCSAGGLAAFLHVDQWSDMLPNDAKVVGLPDSGFFMDYEGPPRYVSYMKWGFEYFNSTSGVNQDCIEDYKKKKPDLLWQCYFAQYTSPYIRTPIFPLQPRFDSWQIHNILGDTNVAKVNEFGSYLTREIFSQVGAGLFNGIWLDSCEHHCGGWGPIIIDGKDMAAAFLHYYTNSDLTVIFFQDQAYPCDSCCNGGPTLP